jgi:putative Ca2+/H+ antiporter (TMEM165/GDT1 family)
MGVQSELAALLFAAGAVVLAEMGDKTQLLAMAFAAKYKASKVLMGVFIATVLNHGLAVWVGNLITHLESAQVWIQAVASLSFIFFGLWTIRGDKLEGEENKKSRFGAVATVAIAFFFAEMGDKTQLATVAIATKFPESPFWVLAGTTAGMLIADGIGIIVGVVLCRKIPERIIKLVSAGVFIIFGLVGCYEVASESLGWSTASSVAATALLAVIALATAFFLIRRNKENEVVVLSGKNRPKQKGPAR